MYSSAETNGRFYQDWRIQLFGLSPKMIELIRVDHPELKLIKNSYLEVQGSGNSKKVPKTSDPKIQTFYSHMLDLGYRLQE